jgi:hypothetical protein
MISDLTAERTGAIVESSKLVGFQWKVNEYFDCHFKVQNTVDPAKLQGSIKIEY